MTIATHQYLTRPVTRRARRMAVAFACGLAAAGAAFAIDDLSISLGEIDGGQWRAEDIEVFWSLGRERGPSRLSIARLSLPGFGQPLRDVRVECPIVEVSRATYGCERALLKLSAPALGAQAIQAKIRYARVSGALDVELHGLRLGSGAASAAVTLRNSDWSAKIKLNEASAASLAKVGRELGFALPPLTVAAGSVTLDAQISGRGSLVRAGQIDASVIGVTLNNESGSIATDGLSFDMRAGIAPASDRRMFTFDIRSSKGQAYAEPIFLDFGIQGATVSARGTLASASSVTFERFTIEHGRIASISGHASIDLDQDRPLRAADVELHSLEFPAAYASYMQPWLLDTNFKALKTSGSLNGRVRIEGGAPRSAELQFNDISFDDASGAFGLTNVNGRWMWRDEETDSDLDPPLGVDASRLRWRRGVLLGLELGAAELEFSTLGRQFRLTHPARIPVLDGSIDLETFRVRGAGTPKVAFLIDAVVQPISVDRLCRAFGWPEFGGQVGGAISKLRMREGVITLGAALRAQVFDGVVSITDLRLEQPFSEWPRLYSSVALERLDLELVTRAFSFGRITGRLSGSIRDLTLFNWTPVAFDARFYTPADDRSRRRISQRAVENIGSIGGSGAGVAAALSSGFLRFFDDFNYDQLGLSCRLENEVCRMNGVAPAPNGGYYLVKGKGLPRIDVIGNAQRVDWPRLVQQLIAITKSEGPVVQ